MAMGIDLWEWELIPIAAFQRIASIMRFCSLIRELEKHSHFNFTLAISSPEHAGASIPPNTLEQVPPPLPLLPPLPPPLLSFPLPLEVGPLIAARGSGGAL